MMITNIVAHIPVIHAGHLKLFEKYRGSDVYLLDHDLINELSTVKEIRALSPYTICRMVEALSPISVVRVMDQQELQELILCLQNRFVDSQVIMPNEEITRELAKRYFADHQVVFENTFLRWDEASVLSQTNVPFDRISTEAQDREIIRQIEVEAQTSSDWWRRVGAMLLPSHGSSIQNHNTHVPSEYTPYMQGDPRDFIKAGTMSEYSSVLHAEKGVFARALRQGISTLGADLYVTTFPCPDCAKLVAFSGVRRVFFKTGHASLDGVTILKSQKVEIIKVE